MLACPACERRYFLPRAGRSLDDERLQLEPVPLLAGDSGFRVALAGMSDALDRKAAARRQADLVSSLRRLSKGSATPATPATNGGGNGAAARPGEERCDLCGKPLPADHRHLLHLDERHILCACESCLALRGGDRELRPTGTRVVWLDDFELPDELWASFSIPIGLAFFMHSSASGGVVALYPSPAGATESELELEGWQELCGRTRCSARSSPTPRR